jgi:hypothetical protein
MSTEGPIGLIGTSIILLWSFGQFHPMGSHDHKNYDLVGNA